ncbi:hypothetical protein TNCV_1522951 [Trichonephila clavipes]|nr:hypothetical protein TNCV_1522951 [Trichonephila clavipes]
MWQPSSVIKISYSWITLIKVSYRELMSRVSGKIWRLPFVTALDEVLIEVFRLLITELRGRVDPHSLKFSKPNFFKLTPIIQSKASLQQQCSCHPIGPCIRTHAHHHQSSINTKPSSIPDRGLRDRHIPVPCKL